MNPALHLISLLLAASSAAAAADCQFIAGNHYCNPVQKVTYNNVGFSGAYSRVTSFDNSSCSCQQEQRSFSGTLSPLDEELSVHFRGPINLKQFAYYSVNMGNSGKKTKRSEDGEEEDHAHEKPAGGRAHHHHIHKREPEVVYVTNAVYVTQTVYADDAVNNKNPATASTFASENPAPSSTGVNSNTQPQSQNPTNNDNSNSNNNNNNNKQQSQASPAPSSSVVSSSFSSSSSSSSSSAPSESPASFLASDDFVRTGYYSASSGTSDGLVFLNSMGGAGSGVWDSCFGNSLSYAGADGISCASSPTTLSDVTLASNKEFSIFSNSKCSGDSCGYYRPGSVAYHGFGGDTKIFAFEFSMPFDTSSSASTYNYDMPAVWLLNAQIPRTLQYGNSACSCWATGCGELDLFEVLNSGNTRLTNHLHSGQNAPSKRSQIFGEDSEAGTLAKRTVGGGGGTPDFIKRPTDATMKAAAVFQSGVISIVVLPDDTKFDGGLSAQQVEKWLKTSANVGVSFVNL